MGSASSITRESQLVADGFATVTQAMEYTQLSRASLYKAMDSRELPFAKMGRCRRIPWVGLREFAQKKLVGA